MNKYECPEGYEVVSARTLEELKVGDLVGPGVFNGMNHRAHEASIEFDNYTGILYRSELAWFIDGGGQVFRKKPFVPMESESSEIDKRSVDVNASNERLSLEYHPVLVLGERWLGKKVHVGEVDPSGKWVWVPNP